MDRNKIDEKKNLQITLIFRAINKPKICLFPKRHLIGCKFVLIYTA